jgi:hypothetical protein
MAGASSSSSIKASGSSSIPAAIAVDRRLGVAGAVVPLTLPLALLTDDVVTRGVSIPSSADPFASSSSPSSSESGRCADFEAPAIAGRAAFVLVTFVLRMVALLEDALERRVGGLNGREFRPVFAEFVLDGGIV